MPSNSNSAHVSHLVKLLTYVTRRNESISDNSETLFHCTENEQEALHSFIARLDDNIRCSETCYATALVYIDRITEMSTDLTLNCWTVQRLFTTSLLVANQFLDDTAERALQFSRVAGFDALAMAAMKTDFLFRIQFRLVVSDEEVLGYSDKLQGRFSTAEFARLKLWSGKPCHVEKPPRVTAAPAQDQNVRPANTTSSPSVVPSLTKQSSRKYYNSIFSRSLTKAPSREEGGVSALTRCQTEDEAKGAASTGKPQWRTSRSDNFVAELNKLRIDALVL